MAFSDLWKGSRKKEFVSSLSPEQSQMFNQFIGTLGPQALQSFQSFLGPQSQEDINAVFEKSYTQPALATLNQQILPAIQQRFVDLGAGSSGALNQALSTAASDVATSLGQQYGNFYQNQQRTQMEALMQFLPFLFRDVGQNVVTQRKGIAGPFMQALGTGIGGAVGGPAGASIGGSLGGTLGSSMQRY